MRRAFAMLISAASAFALLTACGEVGVWDLDLGRGIDNDDDGYVECTDDGNSPDECDCDDNDPDTHPHAVEICKDGIDNDCDGLVDGQDDECPDDCDPRDRDCDGYTVGQDCNDNNPYIHPGAYEVCDNNLDDNCDGRVDEGCGGGTTTCTDQDGDGSCLPADCNDLNPNIHPGADENCTNLVDDNCDGLVDGADTVTCGHSGIDHDQDGYDNDVDCNDNDPNIHPGATEICSGGVDEDCDSRIDLADPDCLPDDLQEGLDWIRVRQGDGTNCPEVYVGYRYVFDPSVNAETVHYLGIGFGGVWTYAGGVRIDSYDPVSEFMVKEFCPGFYRVTMMSEDNDWARFDDECRSASDESAVCHENTDGTYSLCWKVEYDPINGYRLLIPPANECRNTE